MSSEQTFAVVARPKTGPQRGREPLEYVTQIVEMGERGEAARFQDRQSARRAYRCLTERSRRPGVTWTVRMRDCTVWVEPKD